MGNVSRPLIGLLVATVAFFALWTVALKPSSSSSSGAGSKGAAAYQGAINAAHRAVATSNADNASQGGAVPTASPAPANAKTSSSSAKAVTPRKTVRAIAHGPSAGQRLDIVSRALKGNKVLALLFYNPGATDDQAVKLELAGVPAHGGNVVKIAVPLSELARYPVVTSQVPVLSSPTLVLIDPHHQASTIAGFADRFEIAQRVADALSVK